MSAPCLTPAAKKRRPNEDGGEDDKDSVIAALKKETAALKSTVASLQTLVEETRANSMTYFASTNASVCKEHGRHEIPKHGMSASHVRELIEQIEQCDFKPRLNTSSYVNVVSEPEEREVAMLGAQINIADSSVYPASVRLHDTVVNFIAQLWNAPPPPTPGTDYCGTGTVGSTEACLLAGLALKFRWRKWYGSKNNLSKSEVDGIRPNLVISTCYQAAWEKFFRYFDVDAKFAKPSLVEGRMAVDPKELVALCDEKTLGVVAILGNHWNGMFDPVWDIDAEVKKLNEEKGFQVGIHIDAASGGFIAPFLEMGSSPPPPFDFRLDSVLSISSSGHKFGESVCGTGWLVFRQREDLAEHIAVTVNYLGGHCDSMTLNFSRPASGYYVQFYKLMRLGLEGYRNKVENQMMVAAYLRSFIRDLKHPSGKPRFQVLDGGDTCCLPVVSARINPELNLKYNDIDLQHALSESHWYVSGYKLAFENFQNGGKDENLCTDVDVDTTMFRIVCKSNLTMSLARDLASHLVEVLPVLDSMQDGYSSMRSSKALVKGEIEEEAVKMNLTPRDAAVAAIVAGKWMSKMKHAQHKRVGDAKHPKRRGVYAAC